MSPAHGVVPGAGRSRGGARGHRRPGGRGPGLRGVGRRSRRIGGAVTQVGGRSDSSNGRRAGLDGRGIPEPALPGSPRDGVAGALVETKAGEAPVAGFWMASSRSATFCRRSSSTRASVCWRRALAHCIFNASRSSHCSGKAGECGIQLHARSAATGGCTGCSGRRRSCSPRFPGTGPRWPYELDWPDWHAAPAQNSGWRGWSACVRRLFPSM